MNFLLIKKKKKKKNEGKTHRPDGKNTAALTMYNRQISKNLPSSSKDMPSSSAASWSCIGAPTLILSPSRVSKWVKHHQHLPLPSPLISPTNLKEQSQLATPIGEKFKIGREACKLVPYSPSGSTDNYHTKWGRSRIQARMPIRLLLTHSELIHMKNLTLFKEILLFQKNYLQVLLWLPPDKPHLQLLLISIGSEGKQLWKMPQYMKSLRIGIWFEYTDQYHQV